MPEILASCWTTAGDALPVPGRDASPLDMVARIEAAGRAGFSGFGMVLADLQHIEATAAWSDVAAALGASGLAWVELEILQDWWLPTGPQRQGCDRQCRLLFEAADRFSAFRLKVAGDTVDLRRPDLDAWAGQLHALCDAAANHGLGVALEFLRFSNIPDLSTAVVGLHPPPVDHGDVLVELGQSGNRRLECGRIGPILLLEQNHPAHDILLDRSPTPSGLYDLQAHPSTTDVLSQRIAGIRGAVGARCPAMAGPGPRRPSTAIR